MKTTFFRKCTIALLITLTIFSQKSIPAEGVILYHSKNQFGPLWVHEAGGERFLSFQINGPVVQSLMKLEQPDAIQFEYLKMILGGLYLNKIPPGNILLLGLGGGTLAKAINTILPQSKLDIVEINPLIPEIAKRYFLFEPNENTKIFVTDGYLFIKNTNPEKYDLIIIDVFDKDYIPRALLTSEFAQGVKKSLKPDGVAAVNTFNGSKFNETESRLYKETFGSFFNLTNETSRIILAKKGVLPSLNQISNTAKNWAFSLYRIGVNTDWLTGKFARPN